MKEVAEHETESSLPLLSMRRLSICCIISAPFDSDSSDRFTLCPRAVLKPGKIGASFELDATLSFLSLQEEMLPIPPTIAAPFSSDSLDSFTLWLLAVWKLPIPLALHESNVSWSETSICFIIAVPLAKYSFESFTQLPAAVWKIVAPVTAHGSESKRVSFFSSDSSTCFINAAPFNMDSLESLTWRPPAVWKPRKPAELHESDPFSSLQSDLLVCSIICFSSFSGTFQSFKFWSLSLWNCTTPVASHKPDLPFSFVSEREASICWRIAAPFNKEPFVVRKPSKAEALHEFVDLNSFLSSSSNPTVQEFFSGLTICSLDLCEPAAQTVNPPTLLKFSDLSNCSISAAPFCNDSLDISTLLPAAVWKPGPEDGLDAFFWLSVACFFFTKGIIAFLFPKYCWCTLTLSSISSFNPATTRFATEIASCGMPPLGDFSVSCNIDSPPSNDSLDVSRLLPAAVWKPQKWDELERLDAISSSLCACNDLSIWSMITPPLFKASFERITRFPEAVGNPNLAGFK